MMSIRSLLQQCRLKRKRTDDDDAHVNTDGDVDTSNNDTHHKLKSARIDSPFSRVHEDLHRYLLTFLNATDALRSVIPLNRYWTSLVLSPSKQIARKDAYIDPFHVRS
jgi:hypothetical protein